MRISVEKRTYEKIMAEQRKLHDKEFINYINLTLLRQLHQRGLAGQGMQVCMGGNKKSI